MFKSLSCCLFATLAFAEDVSFKEKLTSFIKEEYDGVATFDASINESIAQAEYKKYTNGEYAQMQQELEKVHKSNLSSLSVESDFTFDQDDKKLILKIHNDYRSALCSQDGTVKDSSGNTYPGCSDVNYLFWDDALEKVAQGWADSLASSCSGLSHNSDRSSDLQKYKSSASFIVPSNAYVGENVGYYGSTSGSANIEYATSNLDSMWDEDSDWSYQAFTSSSMNAGHFTQMAWANTRYVACAGAMCKGDYYNYYTVCDYYPGGNYLNEYPYSSGMYC